MRTPERLTWDDRDHRRNVQHVFIAVDPSGGGASAFSICSAIMLANGSIQVRALSAPRNTNGCFGHKRCRVAQRATNESGRCPKLAINTGPATGRTRTCRSSKNSCSAGLEWKRGAKLGSRHKANSTTPRLHAMELAWVLGIFMTSVISRSAWRNARLSCVCSSHKSSNI